MHKLNEFTHKLLTTVVWVSCKKNNKVDSFASQPYLMKVE